MPMWLFILIVFVASFSGALFASFFKFERREDKGNGEERIPGKTEG